jgi:hypothetical protein
MNTKLNHKIVLLIVAIIAVSTLAVAAQEVVWTANKENLAGIVTDKAVRRQTFPKEFKLFDLNIDPFRQELFSIVDSRSAPRSTIISLPNADGDLEQFRVFEASNFESELQSRFPDIRAYSGRGITDRYATLKLSISPQGIQGTVFRTASGPLYLGGETEIIEPYSADRTIYAVFKSQRRTKELPWACSTDEHRLFSNWKSQIDTSDVIASNEGTIRVLRLAQSCNGEYAIWHGLNQVPPTTPTEAIVLAAFNGTLTRSNGVYEKDLGVHMNLIPQTTSLIFYDPATDPYTSLSSWNAQLAGAIAAAGITPAMYDIGHMFGASGGGGNAGCIGCVCSPSHDKGMGITSPADGIPQGDNFDIDYVVHEVGHQLGANHTFSYGQLPVPEDMGQDKEVGSGITIMGYAGITEVDTAPHSIDIFHETSIAQVQANLPNTIPDGVPCPAAPITMTLNHPPVVAAVSNYTIPHTTPFILTGSATDPDGDPITYNWEQNDSALNTGVTVAASNANPAKAVGPNWLSFPSTSSPTKMFPKLSTILAGQFTTSATGTDDAAPLMVEALSSVTRDLHFRLTVRDNRPYVPGSTIAQTQFTDMTVSVTSAAGPFKVTAPDSNVTLNGGATSTITWLQAGTDLPPIGAANVNIRLSTDGGLTFPTVLKSNTPNDGTESVMIPNTPTTNARIMIEAANNIFFDVSDTNFVIASPTNATASVGGRITNSSGNGVRGVIVRLVGEGINLTAITNSFGYYRFDDIPTGAGYVLTPSHKTYQFNPPNQFFTLMEDEESMDFSGNSN